MEDGSGSSVLDTGAKAAASRLGSFLMLVRNPLRASLNELDWILLSTPKNPRLIQMEQGQQAVGRRVGQEVVGESRKKYEELANNFNNDY
ncbi:hypothetical protein PAL_GLEAN10014670 [Pteropus alecto]|uniref:Uncharacterized protein n=1 Tax=Pteropus alecto TaxID=9402 RepID=L5KL97_PTEAL|nr:hypothetical protein PAL_GLEAN10014670 [Pteropus alecto]